MPKNLPVLDTNILIRFFVEDNQQQLRQIKHLFLKAESRSFIIPDIILAEIIYVLMNYYQINKKEAIKKISALLEFPKFKTNKSLIKKTLSVFAEHNISFPDAYLCALNLLGKSKLIYSFDQKLGKIKGVQVTAP